MRDEQLQHLAPGDRLSVQPINRIIDRVQRQEAGPGQVTDFTGTYQAPAVVIPSKIIKGKLDGALAAGGTATLSIWLLGAGQTNWLTQSSDSGVNQLVYAPPTMLVTDAAIASGTPVEAEKDEFGNWRVRKTWAAGTALTPFELYDDITPGAVDKNVWLLKAADLTRDETVDKVLVSDQILGDVRAYGSTTKTGGTPSTGARGYYQLGANDHNQIVSIQRVAKVILVANTYSGHAAVAKTTTSFTATFTRVLDDGQNPLLGAATSLVVHNPGFSIPDNDAKIVCVLDTGTGISNCLYRVVDATCP